MEFSYVLPGESNEENTSGAKLTTDGGKYYQLNSAQQ